MRRSVFLPFITGPRLVLSVALFTGIVFGGVPAHGQSLEDVLVTVYHTSPTLNAQRVQLRVSNEQYPQAISNWLPSVSYSRTETDTVTREKAADTGTTRSDEVSHAVSVSVDLYRGGRNFASLRKADDDIRGGREELAETEQTVFLNAVTAYMDTLRDRRRVEIRENNVNVLQRHLDAVTVQYDLRRRTRADLAQAQSRLLAAEAELAKAKSTLVETEERFERIVGDPPGELSMPEPPKDVKVDDDNVRKLIENNPSIKRQKFAVKSADTNVDLVQGELLPSVSVSSSLTRSKSASRDASATVGRTGVVTMTLTVPIYQKGAVFSRLRASKYSLGKEKLTLHETFRTSIENLLTNDEKVAATKVQIRSLEQQVEAAEVARQSVEAEMEVGRRTVIDLLDQEQELLNARLNLISAQRDLIVFSYSVERDIGRLTAQELGLDTEYYDPEDDFAAQRDDLIGAGTLPDLPSPR